MASDSLLLNLLVKEEARINELEVQLESERMLSSQIIQELTQEVEALRVSNCPPAGENQPAAHIDDSSPTFSIIQQLAKEKDELAGQLEAARKENADLGAVLTEQQAVLIEMTTRNNDLQAELSEGLEKRKELKNFLLQQIDDIQSSILNGEEEAEPTFEGMLAEKDMIIGELERKLEALEKYADSARNDLAQAQGKIKEWENERNSMAQALRKMSDETRGLVEKLKAIEEAKNKEPALSETHRKEAEIKKAKKEDYVNKLVHQYMFYYSNIQMGDNEMPLEEYVRKMAEKEFEHSHLGQELGTWRYQLYQKQCQQARDSNSYNYTPMYANYLNRF